MFVAGKHINVERGGKLVALTPGEACPEAADFPKDVLLRCMRQGQIVDITEPAPGLGPDELQMKAESKALAKTSAKPSAKKSKAAA